MAMSRKRGQGDADFLLEVEAQRKQIIPHEPSNNLPFVFVPKLSREYVEKLQFARASKVLSNPNTDAYLTWNDIILVARDDKYSIKLVSEEVTPVSKPVSGPSIRSVPTAPSTEHSEKCSLCKQLGQGLDSHPRERCFIDPKSRYYKPEVR
jgi:hypothetical protein